MNADYLERLIRRTANRFGIDIKRYSRAATESGRLTKMLKSHGIDLVLDIGANVGQFANSLRACGYGGAMVSFEPVSSAHSVLLRASSRDEQWEIAPRGAIGGRDGVITIHVARNSVSSSVLEMLDVHSEAAPHSAYVCEESVLLSKLDTIAQPYLSPGTLPFLKIDTQGYEMQVLDGATELLSITTGVQLELSLVPLYEGQELFGVLCERMQALGFSIWAILPGMFDPSNGRMLQVDATFFRD